MNNLQSGEFLAKIIDGREGRLIEEFILYGPMVLKLRLGLSEQDWRILFDHLVFNHNLLYRVVVSQTDFFLEQFVLYGEKHLRFILDVHDVRYDQVWRVVFDYLAIAQDALFLHFLEHRKKYFLAFKARGGRFLRVLLGIHSATYDGVWLIILNALHKMACDGLFSDIHLKRGLAALIKGFNGSRQHQCLFLRQAG